MKRSRVTELINSDTSGLQVLARGWVRTRRESKEFSFLEINDGSCMKNLQVVVPAGVEGYDTMSRITTGASVEVEGTLVESPGKGQKNEVQASRVKLIGEADPEGFPLQKKRHSFEFLREIAHLRPRTNTFGAVFRVRNVLSFAIHRFFQEKGFVYVHTPIITGSDCEGAGEMFRVTTLDMQNVPGVDGRVDYSRDFFGDQAGLTVSGQLEGEMLALALGDIYTFGPTFRAENSNTTRHLAEFWMVEPEMAFATLEDDYALAEEFLKYIFSYTLEHAAEDMEFFNTRIQNGIIDTLTHIIDTPFEVIDYTEAVKMLAASGETFEFPVEWGNDLQTEHERWLTEKKCKKPVVVVNYPRDIKAFYMKLNEDDKTVRAMDVLVPGVGEIIGGSEREDRLQVLEERMKQMQLDPEEYWWYLDLRRFGSAPHAGFGLGFERTVQFVTGMQNIRDVIPFPRTPGNAKF